MTQEQHHKILTGIKQAHTDKLLLLLGTCVPEHVFHAMEKSVKECRKDGCFEYYTFNMLCASMVDGFSYGNWPGI